MGMSIRQAESVLQPPYCPCKFQQGSQPPLICFCSVGESWVPNNCNAFMFKYLALKNS